VTDTARATEASDRIATVPNAISAFRIALIVAFAVCLATQRDGWAIAALAVAGVSDFFDGFLARRWNQTTRLGTILDPAADRLLTVVMVVGLPLRGVIPWWLAGVLAARDVVVGIALLAGKRRGLAVPKVTFAGKSATFGLYVFLPLAYLAWHRWDAVWVAGIVGAVVAATLYWISGIGYVLEVRKGLRGLR
jgi:cardiolipin synthase